MWNQKIIFNSKADFLLESFQIWYAYINFFFNFIFKLYITVLVLPNIKMNLPQVYMCSPSWTLLPPPSPFHPSGSSQCSSPKHPVSCIEPGLATRFIHDILHVSMPFSQIFPTSPSLCFEFLSVWLLCVSVCCSWGLSSLCFLDFDDYFLSHGREFFIYYLFKYFLMHFLSLCSFWGPYNATVGAFDIVL